MFANTLASVDECGIDYLHVFPYSPRPGTPAAKMPQVARDIVKARAATLREKGAARLNLRLNRHVGLTAMALVEAGNRARLPDFAPVRIDGASPEPGRPALFNLVSRSATELVGQLA
jgi:threonylcarbamoyladenosine tRNA methylthiotransferase MtaB